MELCPRVRHNKPRCAQPGNRRHRTTVRSHPHRPGKAPRFGTRTTHVGARTGPPAHKTLHGLPARRLVSSSPMPRRPHSGRDARGADDLSLASADMRATPLPPRALLSRAEWRRRGVSTNRLAGPELVTVFRGFSTPALDPTTVNAMCRVLQQQVIPGAVISHTTAAALLRIALPWWVDGDIGALSSAAYRHRRAIIVPSTLPLATGAPKRGPESDAAAAPWMQTLESGLPLHRSGLPYGPPAASQRLRRPPTLHCRVERGAQRSAGLRVRVHRQGEGTSVEHAGLVLSHPIQILLELASMLSHDDLVIAIDSVVSREPPIRGLTLERIRDESAALGASWGAPALRRALRDARGRTDSPGETRTRLLLQRAGFPEPVINHPVEDPDSEQVRFIDLAFPDLMIGVEYDGDYHRRSKDQWRKDQARKDSLASAGWDLRMLTAHDLKQPQRFLSALRRTFLGVGAPAPPPSNWSGRAGARLARSLGRPAQH